jgi:DNA-binding beta-propeller fold protein YncE
MVEAARAQRPRGVKPRTLVNIIIILLLLALLGLLIYFFFFLPGGGGIVRFGQKDVGAIRFLFAVYGPGQGDQPNFNRPLAVATDGGGNIFVADTGNSRICKFNDRGRFQWMTGGFGVAKPAAGAQATWKPGYFNFPYGLDVDDAGNVYVADLDNNFISVLDATGKYVRRFPEPYAMVGKGSSGEGGGISGTALEVKGSDVYVADKWQVIKFGTNGKFKLQFGMPGRGPGQMERPNGVTVADDGTIYVSDSNNQRLQAYTAAGKFKWQQGAPAQGVQDFKSRQFGLPRGIDIGPDKNIYMADTFHFTIQVYSPEGKQLAEVGTRGTGDGEFNFPNDVAVRGDGVIYIADRANNRVQAIRIMKFVVQPPEQ